MPKVDGPYYFDKNRNIRVRKPAGKNYYDTQSRRWYKTEWAYRDYKSRQQTGRTAYQTQKRRQRLRSRGYTPTQQKQRRITRQENYDVVEGSKTKVQTACRRFGTYQGYVQAFMPPEYPGADSYSGGSDSYGPNPNQPNQQVPGVWITQSFNRLILAPDWMDTVDPLGSDVFWRVLIRRERG